jgi:3',5'-cyclic AMP phosphodiesterase CpdA
VEDSPVPLLAISDLHVSFRANREAVALIAPRPDAWLILAGDIGERPEHLVEVLGTLASRFARIVWVPGNHDLWGAESAPARYRDLVAICRDHGVLTPEDPYAELSGAPGTFIVPMFLLYDYSFRPGHVALEHAIAWAAADGVRSRDERLINPHPWPSVAAWCHARCDETESRLGALPPGARTVLVNHWPLRYDLARPPRVPRFSIWCGTTRTEDWARRFRARVVVSGHLHFRTTLVRDGVRCEEVSLGYPRDWQARRGINWYVRDVLPAASPDADRFVPARDPFRGPDPY